MIEINNLTKRFGDNIAVNSVTATINSGTVCGLAGSNGSGKSTLLRTLSGVFQPDGGEILIDGESSFENINVKSKCYYISDYPYFSNSATLSKLAGYISKIYPNWDNAYYEELRQAFPISNTARIINMSKGMQRQVALTLAFATRPKYLFLDEIFDGLDPVIRQVLKRLIIENVMDNNMTAVIASHNLREFDDICDTMILLHNGQIVKNNNVDLMKSNSFRVQIAFNEEVPLEIFKDINVKSLEQKGKFFTFIACGDEEDVTQGLQSLNPAFLDIIPLTLEEVFINEMGNVGYRV
jgi:ABC-2 type transport system ATP-binding protein